LTNDTHIIYSASKIRVLLIFLESASDVFVVGETFLVHAHLCLRWRLWASECESWCHKL